MTKRSKSSANRMCPDIVKIATLMFKTEPEITAFLKRFNNLSYQQQRKLLIQQYIEYLERAQKFNEDFERIEKALKRKPTFWERILHWDWHDSNVQ